MSNGVTPKQVEALGRRHLMLFAGRASKELAGKVAGHLGIECGSVEVRDFANGETYARFGESVRGTDAFVIQTHSAPVNERIMEQLIMIDALKRASAKRISAVVPYYGYSRQDKKGRGRSPSRPNWWPTCWTPRGRPADHHGPALRRSGVLRQASRPPDSHAGAGRAHPHPAAKAATWWWSPRRRAGQDG